MRRVKDLSLRAFVAIDANCREQPAERKQKGLSVFVP
jgi:hypothetical protein